MNKRQDRNAASDADTTLDESSSRTDAREGVTHEGAAAESTDAAAADRSGIVIGGATGDQPGDQPQTAQTTGEPGTTVAQEDQRPNIRLRRTGSEQQMKPTGEMIEIPKAGGAEGEMETVPEMKPVEVDVYAEAINAGPLSIGMTPTILMPSIEVQRAGWFEPRAQEIINLHPDRYIAVKEKGA